jgi:D-glycero-D-manno-heptose 1,7-bisphosphate phosphatase
MHIAKYGQVDPNRLALVILDRDNTLCEDFHGMNGKTECVLLPGVLEGLKALLEVNPILAIATNQSYIGRSKLSITDVDDFNNKLISILDMNGIKIDIVAVCPHIPSDQCDCRKPKPGMLLELMKIASRIRKDRIFFLGDNETDIQAAHAAGIEGLMIQNNNFHDTCIKVRNSILESTR